MKKFLSSLKKLFIGQSKFKTNTCSNCTRKQTLFFQNSSLCYSAEDKPFFSNSEMANQELIKGTNVPVIALVALSKKYYIAHSGGLGMCCAVSKALYKLVLDAAKLKLSGYSHDGSSGSQPIPKFNHKIAVEKFGASDTSCYWWDLDDRKSRIQYFDWLIEQYSK